MALSRQQKEALVAEYGERLGRAQVMIWSTFQGLTVTQAQDLRGQLRGAGAEAVVVKNSLMRVALEEAGLSASGEFLEGTNIVTFVYDEIAPAAKVMTDFAVRSREIFRIKGGTINGRVVDAAQVRSLATLPSRDVLLAHVIGGMQAPVSGLVGVLSGVMRSMLNVLNARSEQLEGTEETS